MKQPKMPYKHIAFYTTLLTAVCVATGWLIADSVWLSLIVAVPTIVVITKRLFDIYTTIIRQLDFIFEAVKNNDNSFRFAENPKKTKNPFLNYSLNHIKEIMDNYKEQIRQREKNFELIMECSNVGIMIVQPNGSVLQANSKATTLFGIERISHIDRLNFLSNDLVEVLHRIQPAEHKAVRFQTEANEVNLMLTCTAITINNKELKLITINNIINELDTKEAETWEKITRILTHEIMNSLTPIASISSTLIYDIHDNEKIRHGLETIHSTSDRLMNFVASFRLLSRVPQPQKAPIYIADVVNETLHLVNTKDIEITTNIVPADAMIYADRTQISQVMINLLKNAIEACRSTAGDTKHHIEINSTIDAAERIIIDVINSGQAIPDEELDNIFTPFFTTKKDGTGVGLAISKQIVRLHNGRLNLMQNQNGKVVFRIVLE